MDGIINILKPPHMTSHDVVSYMRKILKQKKVGHTGTLDPMAAGVLPICIGNATKISQFLLDDTKKYRCEMLLGTNTDTQDIWGKVIRTRDVSINESDIYDVFNSFKGENYQIPPMYSAVKIQGKKLYELARQGIEVERNKRLINIYELDILNIYNNKILFDVKSSKGTYVRTLCEDIGNKLNCGATMSFLLRTGSGRFSLENSCTLEEISAETLEGIERKYLFDLDYPLIDLPKVTVNEDSIKYLLNGNNIYLKNLNQKENLVVGEIVRIYAHDHMIALGEIKNEIEPYIDIHRVFN
ncbi:MAG: tRNA pseudouridine(55) synthase TruB [Alkaliphilus sp.]|nr:tRNA pseudouridine(55) synthase TruB [Alkaliphilus sp.]